MAEYLFKRMAIKEGLDVEIFSRGVGAWNGSPISGGSKEALKEVGIDASQHQSGLLTAADVQRADLILVMEEGHRAAILGDYPEAIRKTFRLKDYAGDEGGDIRDPIGSGFNYYEGIRKEIEDALLGLLKKLKNPSGKDKP